MRFFCAQTYGTSVTLFTLYVGIKTLSFVSEAHNIPQEKFPEEKKIECQFS